MRGARVSAVLLVVTALASAPPVPAAPADAAVAGNPGAEERTKLVLRIDGELGEERESALAGLLGPELGSNGVTLGVERSSEPRLAWTAAARRDPRALVLAILDVRDERAWALYVVDAARGRAILRRLPGGVEANAAALEEVAAILTSAVSAVREGLEVASTPVEAVVSDRQDTERPPAVAAPPRAAAPPAQEPARQNELDAAPGGASTSLRPFAAVLGRGATFAGRVVPGAAGELGLRLGPRLGLLVHGAWDRGTRRSTPLGAFELGRSLALLEVGYAWPLGALMLEPRAGSGVEMVRRSGAAGAPGVVATSAETHARFSAVAGLRLRYVITAPLAVELGADATFSPRRIRFTSGESELASVPPFSAGALAGLVLGAP